MSSPESEQFKQLLRAHVLPFLNGPAPLADQRAFLDNMSAQAPIPAGTIVEKLEVAGVPAEWIIPAGADRGRVILYLHGGAYCLGSCNSHRALVASLAQAAGARALLIEYGLAPERPFPEGLNDAVAAYRWLLKQDVSPRRLVIAGDSAGGGLTLATLLSLRDAGDPLPAGAVLLSPWTDLAATGESVKTRADRDPMISPGSEHKLVPLYIGDRDPKTPLASPLYGDLHGLPRLLIHVGDEEILLDDSTRVADKAKAAGVDVTLEVWEGMWHVFQTAAAQVPESKASVEKIGAFIRETAR